MRVLVTGGRDYSNVRAVYEALDRIAAASDTPLEIYEGGQRKHEKGRIIGGADHFACCWARDRGRPCHTYFADWSKGAAAGPIRNSEMLAAAKPDLVRAFPGGKGTADMVKKAKAAGVKVVEGELP